MREVIDYQILADYYMANVINEVNEHIQKGYQPHGSLVFIAEETGATSFVQPMVKYSRTTRERRLEERLELSLVAMKYAMKNIDPAYGTKVLDVLYTAILEIEDMGVAS